jgi:hypothetical protein
MVDLLAAYADRSDPQSVAVVGNQPLPPDPARAKAVDDCDLVIRVNGFIVDEPDGPETTGRKVHVVVFNRALRATPHVFRDYRRRLYLLVEPGRLHWEPEAVPGWWPADLGPVPVSNRDVVLPLSDELGLPSRTDLVDHRHTGRLDRADLVPRRAAGPDRVLLHRQPGADRLGARGRRFLHRGPRTPDRRGGQAARLVDEDRKHRSPALSALRTP